MNISICVKFTKSCANVTAHRGVALQVCHSVDPIRGAAVEDVVVDLVVVVAKSVVSQSLLKNLMLTWRSIMPMQCRLTKGLHQVEISVNYEEH